ncbi:class I SAM-dependent methyltransferase [Spirosoma spitsbergense]|uniref:class I SAM-dependent methyltransferase n=1 Tax=Spirosoma spitsbergense TaxID=431554 RepID=UPI000366489B|nr:SAM-dependent methyltransferase [Spirosoma spitsbergense]
MTAIQPSNLIRRKVTPDDYHFYHTIDLPGLGEMPGEIDLRNAPDEYLGNIIVTNKRVLDMGTANGFLTFYMEKKGASLVSYDFSPNDDLAIVPHPGKAANDLISERRNRIRKINNAYRLSHRLLNSRAELVRGTLFAIPDLVKPVDITTFGSILQHVSNPLLALQQAARITRETIVITAMLNNTRPPIIDRLFGRLATSTMRKIRHRFTGPPVASESLAAVDPFEETGGQLTPERLDDFLYALGFGDVRINYHRQHVARHDKPLLMYTLVANRTESMQSV